MLDEEFMLITIEKPIETEKPVQPIYHVCKGCKKAVPKVYQQGLCKTCLAITFQRLIKVIDAVRK